MISDYLKQIRAKSGLTQKEFGEAIGVSVRTVQNWEQGWQNVSKLAKREIYRQFKDAVDEVWGGGELQEKKCTHPGCANHVTHPCEVCGRIAGRFPKPKAINGE